MGIEISRDLLICILDYLHVNEQVQIIRINKECLKYLLPYVYSKIEWPTYKLNTIDKSYLCYIRKVFSFRGYFDVAMLPDTVTHFSTDTLLENSCKPIIKGALPISITHLKLGAYDVAKLLPGVLPESLTHLNLEFVSEQALINGILPSSLTHLTFGLEYNRELKVSLPNTLTHLTLGGQYNHEIKKNMLPNTLTHLTLSRYFNHEIKTDVLPDTLTHLVLSRHYNHEIKEDAIIKGQTIQIIYF
jgi:hypothetical protein